MRYILTVVICLILGALVGVLTTAIIASGKQADERLEAMHMEVHNDS